MLQIESNQYFVYNCYLIMDSQPHQEQNHLVNLMSNDINDHGSILFPYHNEEVPQEQQKYLTPTTKRKGRPKGLKSSKSKSQIKEEIKITSKNSGHWLSQENKRYHWFLEMYNKHFIHKHLRRMDKIFKTMADFIGTRQAQQCRSHHQKMQKKYHTFYKIIKNLRNQFYMSVDPEHVKADLQNNRIFQYDALITEQAIENERQPQVQQQQDKQLDLQLQLQVDKIGVNHNFFLGDNYQSRFNYQNFE